jgi:hypothetical protein
MHDIVLFFCENNINFHLWTERTYLLYVTLNKSFFVWVAFKIAKWCVNIAHDNISTWVGLAMMMFAMVQTPCLDKTMSTPCLHVKEKKNMQLFSNHAKINFLCYRCKTSHITHVCISMCSLSWAYYKKLILVLVGSSIWSVKPRGLVLGSWNLDLNWLCWLCLQRERLWNGGYFIWSVWHIVQFQLINSKHKLLISKIVMNNSQNWR